MNMSSKPKANERQELHAIPSQEAETGQAQVANGPRDEEIRRRAYEIYLERGEEPGHELDDWFQAERELEDEVPSQAS
jgi:hypothetical protein